VLAELQRRILKAEAALHDKEEAAGFAPPKTYPIRRPVVRIRAQDAIHGGSPAETDDT